MTDRLLLVDPPYVSDFLRQTIARHRLPLVLTEAARSLGFEPGPHTVDEADALRRARDLGDTGERPRVYTVSESSIGWIARNLAETDLPATIDLFKDKVKFRRLIAGMYPEFRFREIGLGELDDLDRHWDRLRAEGTLPLPFVIKPAVGFFSMGVHKVADRGQWRRTLETIHAETDALAGLYPAEVLRTTSFIIEEVIEGEELAVDAYYDDEGEPVVLSLWRHAFSSEADTGDRLYTTSKEIVETYLEEVTAHLAEIGALTGSKAGVRDLPVHVELRRSADGTIAPIEVNPVRFGGWCSTADMAFHAYGFNPYVAYLEHQRPAWEEILNGDRGGLGPMDGNLYSIVVLDNTTGFDHRQVERFDYDRLLTRFAKPIELRRVDHRRYPFFGFVFVETPHDQADELEQILHADLADLITPDLNTPNSLDPSSPLKG